MFQFSPAGSDAENPENGSSMGLSRRMLFFIETTINENRTPTTSIASKAILSDDWDISFFNAVFINIMIFDTACFSKQNAT